MACVRTKAKEPWGVRVLAIAARDVPARVAVYKEINATMFADRAMRVFLAQPGSWWSTTCCSSTP